MNLKECKNNFSTNEESAGDESDSEASNDTASYTSEVDEGQVAKEKRHNKLNIRKICFSDSEGEEKDEERVSVTEQNRKRRIVDSSDEEDEKTGILSEMNIMGTINQIPSSSEDVVTSSGVVIEGPEKNKWNFGQEPDSEGGKLIFRTKSMEPLLVALEGCIGVGKTSTLERMKVILEKDKFSHIHTEAIRRWIKVQNKLGKKSILECSYENPEEYGYDMQAMALQSIFGTQLQIHKEISEIPYIDLQNHWIITERSLRCAREVFTKEGRQTMSKEKVEFLDRISKHLEHFFEAEEHVLRISLVIDQTEAFERMRWRNRKAEAGLTESKFKSLYARQFVYDKDTCHYIVHCDGKTTEQLAEVIVNIVATLRQTRVPFGEAESFDFKLKPNYVDYRERWDTTTLKLMSCVERTKLELPIKY